MKKWPKWPLLTFFFLGWGIGRFHSNIICFFHFDTSPTPYIINAVIESKQRQRPQTTTINLNHSLKQRNLNTKTTILCCMIFFRWCWTFGYRYCSDRPNLSASEPELPGRSSLRFRIGTSPSLQTTTHLSFSGMIFFPCRGELHYILCQPSTRENSVGLEKILSGSGKFCRARENYVGRHTNLDGNVKIVEFTMFIFPCRRKLRFVCPGSSAYEKIP